MNNLKLELPTRVSHDHHRKTYISKNLMIALRLAGVTQGDLAESIGIARSYFNQVVGGKVPVSRSIMKKLSFQFDIPIDELFAVLNSEGGNAISVLSDCIKEKKEKVSKIFSSPDNS